MATSTAAEFIPQASNRVELNFNTDWKWIESDIANGQSPSLGEGGFENISLPHSIADIGQFGENTGKKKKITWYRRHFSLPNAFSGRNVELSFDGAGQITEVWVNGTKIGTYKGRWTPFVCAITPYVNFGTADNVVAVRHDDNWHPEIPPGGGDINWGTGMHGEVTMIITDKLNVDHTTVWTEKASGGAVDVNAKIQVENLYGTAKPCIVTTSLVDADNTVVATSSLATTIPANSTSELTFVHAVSNPNLWSQDDPYLYTLRTQIQQDGTYVDDHSTTTGLRWVGINKSTGEFLLNDQSIRLVGGNKHAFFPYLAGSAPDRLWRKDAHILRYQLGLDSIRTSHYTTDPGFLDECDRVGLLVIEEPPGWGFVGYPNQPSDLGDLTEAEFKQGFRDQFERSLENMMRRDINHPCIMAWSVMPNEGDMKDEDEWANELNNLAKSIDPTRPTVNEYAADVEITDIYSSHNYGTLNNEGPINNPIPDGVWMVGEHNNSLGASFLMPHDAEWRKIQNLVDEMRALEKIWESDAFAAHHWSSLAIYHVNKDIGKGWNGTWRGSPLVDRLRQTTWLGYAYQAQAEREQVGDVLHILNEWKVDSDSTVYVASNCDEVELFKDGTSLGRIAPNFLTSLPQGLFKWDNVQWSQGSTLVAKGYNGGELVEEYTRYASTYGGNEDSLVLYPTTGTEVRNDGVDLTYLIAQIRDANGQDAFYADGNLKINSVSGPGQVFLVGEPLWMADGRAGFYVRGLRNQTGTVTVTAKADVGTLVNGDVTGTGVNQFDYSGSWAAQTGVSDAVGQDLHASSTTNDSFEFRFVGTQIRWYGQAGPGNGKVAVSIDGGSEQTIDCFAEEKYMGTRSAPHYLFYESSILSSSTQSNGEPHVLRVRVTGSKSSGSTGRTVASDSVKVYSGDYAMVSNPLQISVVPMTDLAAPVPGGAFPKILSVSSGNGGSISPPGGVFSTGTQVSLTATPDAGWAFTGWSGDLTGTTSPASLTMNSDKTVLAEFTLIGESSTLTVLPVNGGSINPSGGQYPDGEEVNLTATPTEGWTFDGWTGDLSGTTNPASLTMNGDKTVSAIFSQRETVSQRYQAEDANITDGQAKSVGSDWKGTGFVDLSANGNGAVEWSISVAERGLYNLGFRYAGAADGMACKVSVSDGASTEVVAESLSMPSTNSWNSIWEVAQVMSVNLRAGTHTIRLADVGSNEPQIDEMIVTRLLSPLEAWRQQYFDSWRNAGAGADTEDFDLDAYPNLVEYATGTNPINSGEVPSVTHDVVEAAGQQYLTLTVNRAEKKTDVDFILEGSDTLAAWNLDDVTILQNNQTVISGRHDIPISDADRRFLRFRVSAPASP